MGARVPFGEEMRVEDLSHASILQLTSSAERARHGGQLAEDMDALVGGQGPWVQSSNTVRTCQACRPANKEVHFLSQPTKACPPPPPKTPRWSPWMMMMIEYSRERRLVDDAKIKRV